MTWSFTQPTIPIRRDHCFPEGAVTQRFLRCKNVRRYVPQSGFNGVLQWRPIFRSATPVEPGFMGAMPLALGMRHSARDFSTIQGIRIIISHSWKRNLHTSGGSQESNEQNKKVADNTPKSPSNSESPNAETELRRPQSRSANAAELGANSHHKYLIDRFPHMRSPTREELLAAATGFWSRLKIRFKWFSIRSVRPFNIDEIGAFFSWVLLGHVLWIFLGTTTFFSLIIFAINTVFAQETLARWVGNYLTKSSGVKVVFESAIVPKWRDGVISFKNVFVSRRPGQGTGNVSKGSSKTAAAAALHGVVPYVQRESSGDEEDANYTQFDVTIETVNVTLSFTKWFNGKGLLGDVEVKGIRGVVDRTHEKWSDENVDPKSYRHEHNPGDFEIDSFKMDDVLVTVYQPNNFRPFPVSIFTCHLPQLRRQWLFYDFLSANIMSGSFDNSLFTIHPRQTHGYTGAQLNNGTEENGKPSPWKKHSRIRIDGLNIDHLNRGVQGPFSWIHEGNVDIVADIMFPAENDESLGKVMADFYDRLEATVTSNRYQVASESLTTNTEKNAVSLTSTTRSENDKRFVVTDLRIHLNNVIAVVPLFTRDLSYINNALIRPIVAYINSKRTFIPIQFRLVKRTYEAFARDVVDEQARKRRLKKVGLWSLQIAAQAIFMGMAGNIA
ncbi:Mitochondrial distribution and morphology protein 31, mitochondrial precursor [Emydomyces testavorans]|uniref:Mitochondrial distribution and morphology protein 31, mitochondrial n=1 Tax=Emydomyces testavorans TaxID=2070801 RepID=A0AAF0DLA5_9EURO|nr:Mitochondrial distribution and morphology protein 31, mitochondrial precursor [Emydomyces testavorans]